MTRQELKKWFRVTSLEIKKAKAERKTVRRNQRFIDKLEKEINDLGGPVFKTNYLFRMKYEFRHRHIAYCIYRGRELEQIERPAEDNSPNMDYVQKIILEITSIEEVRDCA